MTTVEAKPPVPRVGVGCLVVSPRTNTVLVLRRARGHDAGKLCSPGGKVDFGETAVQAAVREIYEETGLVLTQGDLQVLGHYDHIDVENDHHYAGPAYLYVLQKGDFPQNIEPEKHSEFFMMDIEEVLRHDRVCDPLRDAIMMYLRQKNTTGFRMPSPDNDWRAMYHFFDLPPCQFGCPLTGKVYDNTSAT